MVRLPAWILCSVLALIVVACGEDSPSLPGTPTPVVTVTTLRIEPATDMLKISETATFSAIATMSDQSTQPVTATWRSDNAAVASVDGGGRVTAVAAGQATINAEASGVTGTRALRVVPDYQGRWQGTDQVRTCRADGDWSGVCDGMIGALLPETQTLRQDRDAVNGEADFDEARGAVSGTIAINGTLRLNGQLTITVDDVTFDVALSDWEGTASSPGRITGRCRITVSHPRLAGAWVMEMDVVSQRAAATSLRTGGSGTLLNRLRQRLSK